MSHRVRIAAELLCLAAAMACLLASQRVDPEGRPEVRLAYDALLARRERWRLAAAVAGGVGLALVVAGEIGRGKAGRGPGGGTQAVDGGRWTVDGQKEGPDSSPPSTVHRPLSTDKGQGPGGGA